MPGKTILRGVAAGLLLLLLTATPGCGPDRPEGPPNILLISIDTLRADHMGCYGYARDTSPFLDSLARQGTYYPWSFINTLGTTPSHTTMLSSLYQETHKVEYHHLTGESAFDVIPAQVALLPQILKSEGYATLGVNGGGRMSPKFGFNRGFDEYLPIRGLAPQIDKMVRLVETYREEGKPMFAFFHTYEVHAPYDPPPLHRVHFGESTGQYEGTIENLQRFKNSVRRNLTKEDVAHLVTMYDAGIRYTDEGMKEMFARLRRLGFLDNCLVVITADHGEEFGEHGGLLHRALNYEEFIYVPLIILGPGIPQGVMDRRMAEAVDITRTILTYAGLEPLQGMEGFDLLAPAPPERYGPDATIFAQAGNVWYTMRTMDWKLIHNNKVNRTHLFHLASDPSERRNLTGRRTRRRDAMMRRLERWKSERMVLPDEKQQAEMTLEELDMLKELGYVYDDTGD
jgi:arylsulfatase